MANRLARTAFWVSRVGAVLFVMGLVSAQNWWWLDSSDILAVTVIRLAIPGTVLLIGLVLVLMGAAIAARAELGPGRRLR
jgi:NADH:ubiquinone oxidoreductase subunit 5 (subunit L)/multisubunit Na+/H+ antiporter MnhA subunit